MSVKTQLKLETLMSANNASASEYREYSTVFVGNASTSHRNISPTDSEEVPTRNLFVLPLTKAPSLYSKLPLACSTSNQ
ncbi:MAG: hypothetical protein ACTSSB_14245 [Candidatus Heimdallarchaeota archaeon]